MANARLQDSLPGHFQRAQDELLSGDLKKAISSFKGLIRDWSIHQGVDGESTQECRYCLGEALTKDEQWNEAELVLAALLVDRVRATNSAERIREALSDENLFIREVSVYKIPCVTESGPIEQTQDDAESSLSTPDQIPQVNWCRRFLAARLRASAVRI